MFTYLLTYLLNVHRKHKAYQGRNLLLRFLSPLKRADEELDAVGGGCGSGQVGVTKPTAAACSKLGP